MIVITDNHAQRLERMRPAPIITKFGEQLDKVADSIVKDAQQSIIDGAISGPGHVPSISPDPPNADTHRLDESGFITPAAEVGNEVRAAAGFDAPYALFLEKGTSRIFERPFLSPATQRNRGAMLAGLAARFREIVGLR